MLGVFVYGTLRPGSWNHDRWLAPFLAGPCRRATLPGLALHHHDRLPMVVPHGSASVVGEVADLDPERYDEGLALLDELEDTVGDEYRRVRAATSHGEEVWVWVAGPAYAAALGAHTLVPSGDWFDVPGAR